MQLGRARHVVELLAVHAQLAADRQRQVGGAAQVHVQVGLALGQAAQQHVARLAPGGDAPVALAGVHAPVGELQRLGRVGDLHRRLAPTPCEVVTSKPSPCSASAATQASASTLQPGRPRVDDDAELVAAEPVGAAVAVHGVREPLAEPHQQAVAGGVAEGVVVLLEAVEVEQHAARTGCSRVACGSSSSRSAIRLRRLRSPVSGSVSASRRLWASTRWFSANTSAVRTRTSSSVSAARARASAR